MENKIENVKNEILETPSKTDIKERIVEEADVYDDHDETKSVDTEDIEPPKPTRKQKENAQKRKVSQKRLDALKRARESKALKRTENKAFLHLRERMWEPPGRFLDKKCWFADSVRKPLQIADTASIFNIN